MPHINVSPRAGKTECKFFKLPPGGGEFTELVWDTDVGTSRRAGEGEPELGFPIQCVPKAM